MNIKIISICALFIFADQKKDSVVHVYRRGLDKVVFHVRPVKRGKPTPKRKIMYTYPAKSIIMIGKNKGIIRR